MTVEQQPGSGSSVDGNTRKGGGEEYECSRVLVVSVTEVALC